MAFCLLPTLRESCLHIDLLFSPEKEVLLLYNAIELNQECNPVGKISWNLLLISEQEQHMWISG